MKQKTPMQEHIERLKEMHKHYSSQWEMDIAAGLGYAIDHAESLLEKEKDVMCEFADDYQLHCFQKSADDYFEETFKTKEK
jgi:hypothetical protein